MMRCYCYISCIDVYCCILYGIMNHDVVSCIMNHEASSIMNKSWEFQVFR
jgi:hypothetical protein